MLLSNKQKVDECNNMSESQKLCSVKEVRHTNEHTDFTYMELWKRSSHSTRSKISIFLGTGPGEVNHKWIERPLGSCRNIL